MVNPSGPGSPHGGCPMPWSRPTPATAGYRPPHQVCSLQPHGRRSRGFITSGSTSAAGPVVLTGRGSVSVLADAAAPGCSGLLLSADVDVSHGCQQGPRNELHASKMTLPEAPRTFGRAPGMFRATRRRRRHRRGPGGRRSPDPPCGSERPQRRAPRRNSGSKPTAQPTTVVAATRSRVTVTRTVFAFVTVGAGSGSAVTASVAAGAGVAVTVAVTVAAGTAFPARPTRQPSMARPQGSVEQNTLGQWIA